MAQGLERAKPVRAHARSQLGVCTTEKYWREQGAPVVLASSNGEKAARLCALLPTTHAARKCESTLEPVGQSDSIIKPW